MLGIKPRALCLLEKYLLTKIHLQKNLPISGLKVLVLVEDLGLIPSINMMVYNHLILQLQGT